MLLRTQPEFLSALNQFNNFVVSFCVASAVLIFNFRQLFVENNYLPKFYYYQNYKISRNAELILKINKF